MSEQVHNYYCSDMNPILRASDPHLPDVSMDFLC